MARAAWFLRLAGVAAALPLGHAAWAGQYSIIPFPGDPGPAQPDGGVVADPSGTLYGTTIGGGIHSGGTVYALTPAGVLTTLHSFGGSPDGFRPFTTLTLGPDGTLYGTTPEGGIMNGGIVFSLSPPPAGQTRWTYRKLHDFDGSTGCNDPVGVLYLAPSGQLYGVTAHGYRHGVLGAGVVYQLTPPAAGATAWHFHVIYAFRGGTGGAMPQGGVTADAAGALYGTTYNGGLPGENPGQGVIYRLSPPASGQTAWTGSILHAFNFNPDGGYPVAELVRDATGKLYGTTQAGGAQGGGTAYELSPPAPGRSQWTYSVLYAFGFALGETGDTLNAPLLPDGQGGFYGTTEFGGTQGFGVAFHLSPPAAGQTQWTEAVLHDFANSPTDGFFPGVGGFLLQDGWLVNTTGSGPVTASSGGYGTIYKLQP